MRPKGFAKEKEPKPSRPADLKYGQTVLEAGEYQCTRCGQIRIFKGENVAETCRECGGHFYFAVFHQRR